MSFDVKFATYRKRPVGSIAIERGPAPVAAGGPPKNGKNEPTAVRYVWIEPGAPSSAVYRKRPVGSAATARPPVIPVVPFGPLYPPLTGSRSAKLKILSLIQ